MELAQLHIPNSAHSRKNILTSSINSANAAVDRVTRTSREEGDDVIVAMSVSPGRRTSGAVVESLIARSLAAWESRRDVMRWSWECRRCNV